MLEPIIVLAIAVITLKELSCPCSTAKDRRSSLILLSLMLSGK